MEFSNVTSSLNHSSVASAVIPKHSRQDLVELMSLSAEFNGVKLYMAFTVYI